MRRLSCFPIAATALLIVAGIVRPAGAAIKLACVGDSITAGSGASGPAKTYPAVLGARLGATYQVGNFGFSGATMLANGDIPYVRSPPYPSSAVFLPNIVVIMLGTNDSKPQNWSQKAAFDGDCKALVAHYAGLPTHPRVFLVLPPPAYGNNVYGISPTNIANGVVPAIRTVAAETATPLIDVYTALSNLNQDFPDNVHPNDDGAARIAETVFMAVSSAGTGADSGTGSQDASLDAPSGSDGAEDQMAADLDVLVGPVDAPPGDTGVFAPTDAEDADAGQSLLGGDSAAGAPRATTGPSAGRNGCRVGQGGSACGSGALQTLVATLAAVAIRRRSAR